MATEGAAVGTAPRTWLLALLGVAVVVFVVLQFGGDATDQAGERSPAARAARTAPATGPLDAAELEVRLEALDAPRPRPAREERNPFRFEARAPRAQAGFERPQPVQPQPVPIEAVRPPPEPTFPPIPLKFIGTVEAPGIGKIAALSDCRFTFRGREGEIIDGRYRLVRIGVESVVIEHVDGTGRTTVRLSGQECVGRQ